jgi:hypothetical protein
LIHSLKYRHSLRPGYEKLVILGAEDQITACADFHKTMPRGRM